MVLVVLQPNREEMVNLAGLSGARGVTPEFLTAPGQYFGLRRCSKSI